MIRGVETLFDFTHLTFFTINLFAFLYKLGDLRADRRNAALWALCFARLGNALAFLFLTPVVYVALGRALGIDNIGTLMADLCIIGGACSTNVMLLIWFDGRGVRRAVIPPVAFGYLAACVTMVVLFFRVPLPGSHPVDFEVAFASPRQAGWYCVLFYLTYGANLVHTAWRTWPPSRSLARPRLRSSLRLCAVGSVFVIGFIGGKLIGMVGRWAGTSRLDVAAVLISPLFAAVGSMVIVGGYTLPRVLHGLTRANQLSRSYRTLYPLWRALYDSTPEIALYPPSDGRAPRRLGPLETGLYRQVIEILDGRRAVGMYVDEHTAAAIELMPVPAGADAEAYREAATIAAGIARKRGGRSVPDDLAEGGEPDPAERRNGDLCSELAWLERVARAFTFSARHTLVPPERPAVPAE